MLAQIVHPLPVLQLLVLENGLGTLAEQIGGGGGEGGRGGRGFECRPNHGQEQFQEDGLNGARGGAGKALARDGIAWREWIILDI
jgi:hypothetical protein